MVIVIPLPFLLTSPLTPPPVLLCPPLSCLLPPLYSSLWLSPPASQDPRHGMICVRGLTVHLVLICSSTREKLENPKTGEPRGWAEGGSPPGDCVGSTSLWLGSGLVEIRRMRSEIRDSRTRGKPGCVKACRVLCRCWVPPGGLGGGGANPSCPFCSVQPTVPICLSRSLTSLLFSGTPGWIHTFRPTSCQSTLHPPSGALLTGGLLGSSKFTLSPMRS